MQAHGGGVILVNGLYYQIGENKLDGSAFQSINCYSSPDLVNWKFVNKLLTVGQGASDLATGRVVERPHVIYNDATKKYVMVCLGLSDGVLANLWDDSGCILIVVIMGRRRLVLRLVILSAGHILTCEFV